MYSKVEMESYLPTEIIRKIMMYNSHPLADLLKNSPAFNLRKYKTERTHGCPFDRGGADAYYYREPNPHYWTNGNGRDGHTVYDLTAVEVEAYEFGYFTQTERR